MQKGKKGKGCKGHSDTETYGASGWPKGKYKGRKGDTQGTSKLKGNSYANTSGASGTPGASGASGASGSISLLVTTDWVKEILVYNLIKLFSPFLKIGIILLFLKIIREFNICKTCIDNYNIVQGICSTH